MEDSMGERSRGAQISLSQLVGKSDPGSRGSQLGGGVENSEGRDVDKATVGDDDNIANEQLRFSHPEPSDGVVALSIGLACSHWETRRGRPRKGRRWL